MLVTSRRARRGRSTSPRSGVRRSPPGAGTASADSSASRSGVTLTSPARRSSVVPSAGPGGADVPDAAGGGGGTAPPDAPERAGGNSVAVWRRSTSRPAIETPTMARTGIGDRVAGSGPHATMRTQTAATAPKASPGCSRRNGASCRRASTASRCGPASHAASTSGMPEDHGGLRDVAQEVGGDPVRVLHRGLDAVRRGEAVDDLRAGDSPRDEDEQPGHDEHRARLHERLAPPAAREAHGERQQPEREHREHDGEAAQRRDEVLHRADLVAA